MKLKSVQHRHPLIFVAVEIDDQNIRRPGQIVNTFRKNDITSVRSGRGGETGSQFKIGYESNDFKHSSHRSDAT